jgi:hypothetical protein
MGVPFRIFGGRIAIQPLTLFLVSAMRRTCDLELNLDILAVIHSPARVVASSALGTLPSICAAKYLDWLHSLNSFNDLQNNTRRINSPHPNHHTQLSFRHPPTISRDHGAPQKSKGASAERAGRC